MSERDSALDSVGELLPKHILAAVGDGTLLGAGAMMPAWLPAVDAAAHWVVGWAIALLMLTAAFLRVRKLWREDRASDKGKSDVAH